LFTPSKYGTGTIAFEDLWPSYGDYDFNDVALNYQVIVKLNS
jgi:LruC domain-containing protein